MSFISEGLGRIGQAKAHYTVTREGKEYIFTFDMMPGYPWRFAIPAKDAGELIEGLQKDQQQK